jgi:hypothetical protein
MSAGNLFARYARELASQWDGPGSVLIRERASIYPITGGADLCPVCWLNNQNVPVCAMGGGDDSADFFHCGACCTKFEVPLKQPRYRA